MEIKKTQNNETTTLTLTGRLDTITAKNLEAELPALSGVKSIILDFAGLEYISSAGLRVLLILQRQADGKGGTLRIVNVCDDVMEVFNMTGFSNILKIE